MRFAIHKIFVGSLRNNVENWAIFTAAQKILIGLPIAEWEVKEHLKLSILCIYYIVIRSELKYLIGAIDLGVELAIKLWF